MTAAAATNPIANRILRWEFSHASTAITPSASNPPRDCETNTANARIGVQIRPTHFHNSRLS